MTILVDELHVTASVIALQFALRESVLLRVSLEEIWTIGFLTPVWRRLVVYLAVTNCKESALCKWAQWNQGRFQYHRETALLMKGCHAMLWLEMPAHRKICMKISVAVR